MAPVTPGAGDVAAMPVPGGGFALPQGRGTEPPHPHASLLASALDGRPWPLPL